MYIDPLQPPQRPLYGFLDASGVEKEASACSFGKACVP